MQIPHLVETYIREGRPDKVHQLALFDNLTRSCGGRAEKEEAPEEDDLPEGVIELVIQDPNFLCMPDYNEN